MALTSKQIGVLIGMASAAVVAVLGLSASVYWGYANSEVGPNLSTRLRIVLAASVMLLIPLAFAIGRLARHRFFSPEDIDGSALTKGTERAIVLQAILQNTLEQVALGFGTYLVWAVVMPAFAVYAVVAGAVMFIVGRFAFALGYSRGAPARALGFALTFYPTLIMLLCVVAYLLRAAVAG